MTPSHASHLADAAERARLHRGLEADLAEMERADPAVAKSAADYDRAVAEILAAPLDVATFDHVRLVAIGCADADRIAGRAWECRCVYCRMAIRELVRRAIEREEQAMAARTVEAAGEVLRAMEGSGGA